MSDAFADLWNSTGVSKPAEPPRKLGAMAAATPFTSAQGKPQNDVFSMLAAAGSSSSVSTRATTPAQSSILGGNVPARPVQKATSAAPNGAGVRGDAFSGLLSGSLSSGPNSNGAHLTMAQRAALAEKQKQASAAQTKTPSSHVSSAWAGLDALGGGTSAISSTKSSTSSHDPLDDLGFGSFSSAPTTSRTPSKSPQPPTSGDDWLSEFTTTKPSAPSASKSKPTSKAQSLLDWGDFESDPPARPSPRQKKSQNDTLGDFDFGDREDGLLGDHSGGEDDILGDLGKPVEQLQAERSVRDTPSPQLPQSGQRSRAVSPPPHLLGQIVEMGFSVQQARIALAATDTGLDVQAALETLLANGAASPSPPPEQREERRQRSQRGLVPRRDYGSDEDDGVGAPPSQRQRPVRDRALPDGTPPPRADNQRNLQEQADKLISQASEIGLTMFSRANAFWKEGKERVQRAYEERVAVTAAARPNAEDSPRRNGRPKWMQDAPEDGHVPDDIHASGGFRDFDHEEPSQPSRSQPKRPAVRARESQPVESPASRFKTDNLLSEDAPSAYVSPWRRKTPSRGQSAASSPAPPTAASAPSRPTPPRAPSPVVLIQRTCVSASSAAIAASAQHKALGTEKFKLGQYGEAEALYSAAIAALPAGHLLLVPLLTNRALTRLKNGDAPGAAEDCTAAIALVGPAYHPAREAKVVRADEGAGVDLADALVKAYRRRAEAYEGREKWELARADWEVIAGAEFAGRARAEAVAGIGRCRRMLSAGAENGASSPSKPPAAAAAAASRTKAAPKPKPSARARVPTPPSEALNRVQAQNRAAEAEDQQKAELKDTVDAKLGAWKAGKENNIRALIASLDMVLWTELGWQKVGIHELVSPGQVKIRYTKAIAKLHPDKLNVKNTTLEQRMIANGVFGTLNEAWNAFKP